MPIIIFEALFINYDQKNKCLLNFCTNIIFNINTFFSILIICVLNKCKFREVSLQLWHGGQDHAGRGDEDQQDGDVGDEAGGGGALRPLEQVPQPPLVGGQQPTAKLLRLGLLLLAHLLQHVLLADCVLVLAAGPQEHLSKGWITLPEI